jgi:polyisoprenyl-phosphate glycosyltransferase
MENSFAVSLDIVIPLYNESEVLPSLLSRLKQTFAPEALQRNGLKSVRYVFVDDGSRDDSAAQILQAFSSGLPGVLLRLSRNFGHQNAVTAGLSASSADVTAVMDADLQDPPEAILGMLGPWRQGNDVVYGVRRKRKEGFIKRACYWCYYRLLSSLSEIEVPKDSGDFGLMDARVVKELMQLPEKLRFPRGLRAWVGFRQAAYVYDRDARFAGTSKYPFKDLYKLATDGIVSLSAKPLKLVQLCTFIFAIFFFLCLAATLWWALQARQDGVEMWFLVSFTLSALSGFFTLFSLFIICGYLGRMFFEIKGRPSFIVMETIDGFSLPKTKSVIEWEHYGNDRIPFATEC